MTVVAIQLRPVQQLGVAFAGIDDRGRVRLDGIDATPDLHHLDDVLFDEFHRLHHLADTLAGQVLEIAGLEDRDDLFLDILAKQLLLVGRDVLGQCGGGLVDRLDGLEDLLGGLFGAADDGAELAIDLGHFFAVEAVAVQHRYFPLGAADGVVDQVKLDLEFRALLDLGAIGFQQRVRLGNFARDRLPGFGHRRAGRADGRHLGSDRAKLGHDLAVHRADVAAFADRHFAHKGFFDTKTFATDRHEFFPPLHFRCSRPRRFNVRFTREHVAADDDGPRTPTINHGCAAFIQNKRCPENPRAFDDVVNRNAVSVYQTD